MFLIWAYHSTSDVQIGQFAMHTLRTRGFQQVTLIAAPPTQTPGGLTDHLSLLLSRYY